MNVNDNVNENVNENEMYFLLKLENERMYTRIKQLENANITLKEQIMTLAIENSNLLEKNIRKKYTLSIETKEKWDFYHKYKLGKEKSVHWKILKSESDKLYYKNEL